MADRSPSEEAARRQGDDGLPDYEQQQSFRAEANTLNGRLVFDSYDLHPSTYCKETMLFNLDADPYELNDVADDEPDTLKALLELLQGHLEAAGESV